MLCTFFSIETIGKPINSIFCVVYSSSLTWLNMTLFSVNTEFQDRFLHCCSIFENQNKNYFNISVPFFGTYRTRSYALK